MHKYTNFKACVNTRLNNFDKEENKDGGNGTVNFSEHGC